MDKNSSCKCLKNMIDKFKYNKNTFIFIFIIAIGFISIWLDKESTLSELYKKRTRRKRKENNNFCR